ncbi:MAG: phosphoesterase PA-phosphatase releated protein [Candidatus Berkelbacteria bacterium Athens1014_28]|uniref:Phosphoesterase PA-phosphatase releated protein n=1 Tax=Candidatus Berkelbacteria bacterium Athens1014_28 TaxID=2017145 RepID=A0A554LNJ8_9BACT|nr:MAG: phosphoesterase PA-phosphatase releated protein [Candidatus Berkelbacteria bacterium Athens1014_28]
MSNLFDNLRFIDRQLLFLLHQTYRESTFWQGFFDFFSRFGVAIIALSLIYLIVRIRINAVFSALMSLIFSTTFSFIIYIFWQRPSPIATFFQSGEVMQNLSSFPSGPTSFSFAIAITILLYGHKKLGPILILISTLVGISETAIGSGYPSDVIAGIIIGVASGILAKFTTESFEHFWRHNSAE